MQERSEQGFDLVRTKESARKGGENAIIISFIIKYFMHYGNNNNDGNVER